MEGGVDCAIDQLGARYGARNYAFGGVARVMRLFLAAAALTTQARAYASTLCPAAEALDRLRHAGRKLPSPETVDDDPYACVSEHLRRLVLAFAHPLRHNETEDRRGRISDKSAIDHEIAKCHARLKSAGAGAEVIKEACIENAGGDVLLANREFYELHLRSLVPRRNVTVLCIGVFRGESIAVWSDWFWRGRVVGLDVNLAPAAAYRDHLRRRGAFQNGNVQLIETDTTTRATFAATVSAHPDVFDAGVDVVIDDSCHTTNCILATFDNVIPYLRPGGVYFVEDNLEHLEALRHRRQWASFAFKEGEVADGLNTPGSAHHTFISAFRLPGKRPIAKNATSIRHASRGPAAGSPLRGG